MAITSVYLISWCVLMGKEILYSESFFERSAKFFHFKFTLPSNEYDHVALKEQEVLIYLMKPVFESIIGNIFQLLRN